MTGSSGLPVFLFTQDKKGGGEGRDLLGPTPRSAIAYTVNGGSILGMKVSRTGQKVRHPSG